jgi:hypothetical protein
MKDYAFKINIFIEDHERGVLTLVNDDSDDNGSLDGSSSDSDSDSRAPTAATTFA